jgi:16S rRNA (cytosine967-C5)-methyltransferase
MTKDFGHNVNSGRYLAQLVLDRIEQDNAYANLVLPKILNESGPDLERREKALATELVYGTLRHLLKIDYILGRLLSRPFATLKTPVKSVLRLALYQLLFLPDIPARAVCHSAVEQIKHSQYSGLAPLVNGVLRSYLRNQNGIKFPDPVSKPAENLSLEHSHPLWLVKRWLAGFGPEVAGRILQAGNEPPPLTWRVNRRLTNAVEVMAELAQQEVQSRPGLFLEEAILVENLGESVEKLPLFQSGRIFIQDESAMLVAHLVDPKPGEFIVDLCAAPGGKSTHLAELMNDQGEIISVDNHPHKINLIGDNAERLNLTIIKPVLGDARSFSLTEGRLADAVLVDAPCSGTGVLRRRVDARYRRRPEDIRELAAIQQAILDQAAAAVKPGGRLVYSTCTLEPEENQEQIQSFLERHPEFELTDFRAFLPEKIIQYAYAPDSKWLTILPIPGGGDGFFMGRLIKRRQS